MNIIALPPASQPTGPTTNKTVIMEGETWRATMTQEEYAAWIQYDESHPQLSNIPVQFVLTMFLSHFRRGINLNQPLKTNH